MVLLALASLFLVFTKPGAMLCGVACYWNGVIETSRTRGECTSGGTRLIVHGVDPQISISDLICSTSMSKFPACT
jgi:hypothetical protein